MKKIILISCVSKKGSMRTEARNLYRSSLYLKNLAYAKSLNPDYIFILSAKYGLLKLDDIIEPYNLTLNDMKMKEIKIWADKVFDKLKLYIDIKEDEVIFLAGEKYRKYLVPRIRNSKIPMIGLTIGKQLNWLNKKLEEI